MLSGYGGKSAWWQLIECLVATVRVPGGNRVLGISRLVGNCDDTLMLGGGCGGDRVLGVNRVLGGNRVLGDCDDT